jgi:hypothetical protein
MGKAARKAGTGLDLGGESLTKLSLETDQLVAFGGEEHAIN